MRNKRFVELIGASTQSMSHALENALEQSKEKKKYQILEASSRSIRGQRHYQITLKVPQAPKAHLALGA